MLIVSHDREFLDRTTSRTIFLRRDGAHVFKAPFAVAREELLRRDAASAARRQLEDKEITRLEKVAARYKVWGVLNSKFLCRDTLNRGEQALTLVEVHIRDARVETERMVPSAEGPKMHIVHFLHPFDSQDSPGDVLNAQIRRAAFQKNV